MIFQKLGFETTIEWRRNKYVATARIITEDHKPLTPQMDVAYLENGRIYAREIQEFWEKGYKLQTPDGQQGLPLPFALVHALVLVGEGCMKAQKAILDLDNVH